MHLRFYAAFRGSGVRSHLNAHQGMNENEDKEDELLARFYRRPF